MLSAEGRTLISPNARTMRLDGLTYHQGKRTVIIDKPTLESVGRVYAARSVRRALSAKSIHAAPFADALGMIDHHYQQDEPIWGVSGYAQGGFNYATEASALRALYGYLADTKRKPSLTVDGGVSEGNLGLNAVIAAMHEIPTLGCIPLEGLASISYRTFMVVWGNTYQDREVLVGTIPDVLICIGGAEGTRRECETAIENGSVVLMMALREYGPNSLPATYQDFPKLKKAFDKGQLIVCSSRDTLHSSVDRAWARGLDKSLRKERFGKLEALPSQV